MALRYIALRALFIQLKIANLLLSNLICFTSKEKGPLRHTRKPHHENMPI